MNTILKNFQIRLLLSRLIAPGAEKELFYPMADIPRFAECTAVIIALSQIKNGKKLFGNTKTRLNNLIRSFVAASLCFWPENPGPQVIPSGPTS